MATLVTEEIAAAGEEFRKTAAAATEQARQAVGAEQEQFAQNVDRVQQAQRDTTRLLARVAEQNGQLTAAACTAWWEGSLAALSIASWGQERLDASVRQSLDLRRQTREEGAALLRETAEQARRQQAELVRLAQESLRVSLETAPANGTAPGKRYDNGPAR